MDSLKVKNKFEYWFLDNAVEMAIGFNDIVPDRNGDLGINRAPLDLSLTEMANIMEGLFQRGDLLVIPPSQRFDFAQGFIPSRTQIEAAMLGKLNLFYFLTPQGGQRWESFSNPRWEQRFFWLDGELICASREIGEKLLAIQHLLSDGKFQHIIPDTIVWDTLTAWQATYWKTLPVAHRARYQWREIEFDETQTQPQELIEQEIEAEKYCDGICNWYTNYYRNLTRSIVNRVEYWLLDSAVQTDEASFSEIAYRIRLSRADTIEVAHSLFESGDIRAWVFADAEDLEGKDDVVLTLEEIEDCFDRKLDAYYYLTQKGGAKWSAMVNPDWNRYFFHRANKDSGEIASADRDLIEELLRKDTLLHDWALVGGTEEWEILEPWEATYWKTLPRGYRVRYQTFDNRDRHERRHRDPELGAAHFLAYRWSVEVSRWYAFPYLEY